MTDKIKTGLRGENLAADFLERQGYEVMRRNYRYKRAEIDLIVRTPHLLIFVEVKTRSGVQYGEPEQFVNSRKLEKMAEAAQQFMEEQHWQGNIRFDIIAIVERGGEATITHFEDVTPE